ncbi:MAG TPA: sigma-54 dependent transcriptional regulator [Syntrophales bacterium]|nr:sigma-54 dependent transcriptional regulator [Syntrophales bacterium]HOX93450.1 sigma-54 dependent transcriptional regulator [Syntrophales bacterium]HPI56669.1 sigma-54 dependent transcriptional regulator [Syntrophales bacterium]HPN24905.1 sigma-54 dependent transcriptional regulator [Syntrophales bacterium]HQM29714.1 sigma-54 dependent transcriptional regulator [Syntrophales bacterium]
MKRKPILVVDDDPSMRMALTESLVSCGHDVETANDGADAMGKFRKGVFEMVITDIRMPKMNGIDVLKGIKTVSPETPVIVITAYGTVNTAVEAMKEGAADFIMKPFSLDDLELVVKNVLDTSAHPAEDGETVPRPGGEREIFTRDAKIQSILELLKSVAKSRSSVLIQGDSGTGKELLARYIHRESPRRNRPFVAVNCAAIPANLLESEMFGYEKGAFTGAALRRVGKFELADGGTLLLDEISEMDMQLQAKLLRAIQESEIDRLGGKGPVSVDVRIIATTNADLKKRIADKTFREDLFYRLNVIPVKIPPLRERRGDILFLAEHFLEKFSGLAGRKKPHLAEESLAVLEGYPWPGNVRELENVIERAVLICKDDQVFPEHLFMGEVDGEPAVLETPDKSSGASRPGEVPTLREMEKALIFDTLKKAKGNKTRASQLLGISVRTMRNKLNEYKLDIAETDSSPT